VPGGVARVGGVRGRGAIISLTDDTAVVTAVAPVTTREGWRLIGGTLRDQWVAVTVGVGVGLMWTLAKVSVPRLVGGAINNAITPGDTEALVAWSIAIAFAAACAALFTGLRRYWAFKVSRQTEAVLRERLFAHLQRLHFAFHDRVQTGDLMSRANTDLQQIQFFVVMIPLTISNFVTVVAVTVILVSIDPWLALLALGALPLVNYLAKRFSTRLHPEVMAIQRESAELASVVEETVSGVRVVKGFGSQRVQATRLRAEADDVYDASMAAARVRGRYLPALDLLPSIGLILVLFVGGHQVLDGTLSLGDLVEFNIYIGLLIWPLRSLGQIIASAQRASASAQRVQAVLATDPEIVDRPGAVGLPDVTPHGEVRFEGVSFGYEAGRDVPVVDRLDLRIAAGESVALVGATGSGKSTVARLLPRFYDVDAGRILIDGVDVADVRVHDLRAGIGLVFEETFLFSDTIGNNIAFADLDADDEVIERAARLAGADEFIRALPDGYATEIGERGFSLSGGQRQRIAIARAILADPRVLILDDATSSVDPTKEHEIRDALAEVMRGRTTVVIAHRPATIALADRVVLLDAGRIVAEGTHTELLARSDAYRQVLAAAEAHDREALEAGLGSAPAGDGVSTDVG
jgi:ATP-binding cassette subfamily B protein